MKQNKLITFLLLGLAVTVTASCEMLLPSAPNGDEVLDGPVDGLSAAQSLQHLRGDADFNDQIFTAETGLGPVFVATSCGSCHAGDGKGHPFTTLTRFGQTDSTGNHFLNQGGPQLQNRALPGFMPEQIPAGATSAKFMPPINTGLGFLELVSDADILTLADPDDSNADGISGVPNWITLAPYLTPHANAVTQNGKYIHRFGKKAAAYNLLNQTVNAYNQDIGVTSVHNLLDAHSLKDTDPEVSTQTVNDVVFYVQTLKAPNQRNKNDATVQLGKNNFIQIGCENCHKETLQTTYSPVEALSYKAFHPYTDLLLHDMGNALDDGYTEGSAKTSEWRTPPLWGLGLAPNSQGGKYFLLHDGRARSIEEAIQLHEGEATTSKNGFNQLTQSGRDAVIKFLKSL